MTNSVWDGGADAAHVLEARCLRMGSRETPYHHANATTHSPLFAEYQDVHSVRVTVRRQRVEGRAALYCDFQMHVTVVPLALLAFPCKETPPPSVARNLAHRYSFCFLCWASLLMIYHDGNLCSTFVAPELHFFWTGQLLSLGPQFVERLRDNGQRGNSPKSAQRFSEILGCL